MIGLLTREPLALTWAQQAALLWASWIWLGWRGAFWGKACLSVGIMLVAFWQVPGNFDVRILVNQLPQVSRPALSEFAQLNHLKWQPPAWLVFLSWFPGFAWQQVFAASMSLLVLGCCRDLYGDRVTALIGASPLFLLCCTQPMNGLYALAWLLVGRVAWHQGRHWLAISFVLLACCTKYTVYGVLPFFVWEFGIMSAWIGVGLVGYWLWFSQTGSLLYASQSRWLLSHFTLSLSTGKAAYIVQKNTGYRLPRFLQSGMGALWYLWPMVPVMRLYWVVMAGALLFGGGNIKYLLPMLACLPKNTYG